MGDHRFASKRLNPYDLGDVARGMREYQVGRYDPARTEPYVPSHRERDRTESSRKETELKEPSRTRD